MKNFHYLTAICVVGVLFMSSCKKDETKDTEMSVLINFEELSLKADTFWNGADKSGKFTSGIATFGNSYNSEYGSWSGFAYSNMHDIITAGYGNQYSVFAQNNDGGNKFVVGNGHPELEFSDSIKDVSLKLALNTYAYLSMKNGDDFAKKFGGTTGNDKDSLKLTITINGSKYKIANIMLADFRSDDNSKDFITNMWNTIDLKQFGWIKKMSFSISSSDNDPKWGMNTPANFCLDDIAGKMSI